MPHICLFEDAAVRHLEPLVLTRAVADLRLAAFILGRMHAAALPHEEIIAHTRAAVADVTRQEHPGILVNELPDSGGVLFTNARWVPEPGDLLDRLAAAMAEGGAARRFVQGDTLVAAWDPSPRPGLLRADALGPGDFENAAEENVEGARLVGRLWDLLIGVEEQIARDLRQRGGFGTEAARISPAAHVSGSAIRMDEGAQVRAGAVVSADDGPVWLDKGAVVQENAVVKGPVYLGPGSTIKAASRVDGSAVGPRCKLGGEVHGSVIHSYTNKGHDGYLGNSYVGRWCNLGADTNTSNLKNDYGEVTMHDRVAGDFVGSGTQFLGLVMADHSKCSINTMFNTGTVVGVFCNLFGAGFPPRHVPDFAWGGADGFSSYRLEKALRVAEAVMARRDTPLTDADRALLAAIADASTQR